jgi:D-alanyl-D-alanine carboxypeptidase
MTTRTRTSRTHRPAVPSRSPFLTVSTTVAILTALGAGGCDDEPSGPPPNSAAESGLQQVLDDSVAKPDVMLPGAVAYYHQPGFRPWSGAAGLGEVPAAVAMRPDDRFRAGSVLKTFLATVTLQQVEEGRLALEQTLPELLPAETTSRIHDAGLITLRMLLGHTSGIPEFMSPDIEGEVLADHGRVWSPEEVIALAAAQPPTFAPGTSWSYSNTNYVLVGMILDRAGGKSWRTQVRERVLTPLDLASTRLPEPGDRTVAGPYAHGYQQVDDAIVDLSDVDPSMAGAAGGHAMETTAEDLGRFLEALLAGRLFAQPGTLATMTAMIDAPHISGLPYRYGLGLEQFTMPDGTVVVGHSGSTAGYAVMMFRIPARDTTLVTAVNTNDLFVNALDVFIPSLGALK